MSLLTRIIRIVSRHSPIEYTNGCAHSLWLGPVLVTIEKWCSWQPRPIWKRVSVDWMPD